MGKLKLPKVFQSKEQREAARAQKDLEKARAALRKPDEIGKEYTALCGEAGDKQYRMKVLEMELKQVNERMAFLNQEFHRAKAAHAPTAEEAKALAAATKAVDAPPAPNAQSEAQNAAPSLQ